MALLRVRKPAIPFKVFNRMGTSHRAWTLLGTRAGTTRRALVALLALAALLASGCGGSSDTGSGTGADGSPSTLTVTYNGFPDYLDPSLGYTNEAWTAMYDVYLPLLTYAHRDGTAGTRVIPGLAKSMPKVSDGGRTYELQLRPGLRYSDGTPVRASDFASTIERLFLINSPGLPFYTDIVGAEEFMEKKKGGIAGIETDDASGRVVIHLVEPRGTFNNELALLFAAPLPPNTPAKDMTNDPPPGAGPYEISASKPGRGFEITRNPEWAAHNGPAMPQVPAGHIDRFEVSVLKNPSTQVNYVLQGKTDWMQNPPAPDRYPEIAEKYTGTQFEASPQIDIYYFWMNTQRPPFNDVRVRKAVNYAIDPRALERIYAGQMKALHQILPVGMPGHQSYDPYPHNMAKAKQLIAEADPSDRDISVFGDTAAPNNQAAEYYEGVLRELGFHPTLKLVAAANFFTVIGNTSTPELDTGWTNWFEDYPHPNDYFQPQLDGNSIQPTGNSNWAMLDDPAINKKIEEIGREQLGPKQEAEYAALDRQVMREQAPWAPFGSLTRSTFVSSAVDLQKIVVSPIFGQGLTSFQFR